MSRLIRKAFKQFVTLQRGFDLPKRERVDGDYPVVASTSIQGYHVEYRVDPPGVVTGRSGSLGQVLYVDRPFWPLNTTLWVKDFKNNLPKYVYYFLQTLGLERYNSGAGVPTLNRNHLDSLKIKVHDLPTQHKIASILSAYDDLIENNMRRIKILQEMAQALYREWFVKFRFPGHDNSAGQRNWTDEGRPEGVSATDGANQKVRMVDSPLGKIPEGWEVQGLGDVIELAYGKGLKKSDRRKGNIPVFGSSGIVGYHDEYLVEGPGIIVGRKGNVGSVLWSDKAFFPIDTVFYVVTDLPLRYVYFGLQNQNFINSDAAVPGLSRNQAYLLPFVVPPMDIMEQFDSLVTPTFSAVKLLKQKNLTLCQTRDLLLPRLISGELDVSNLDIDIRREDAS